MIEKTYENYYKGKSDEIRKAWVESSLLERRRDRRRDIVGETPRSALDIELRAVQAEFLRGEWPALIWRRVLPYLTAVGVETHGLPQEQAEDAVIDAMLYVQLRGEADFKEDASLLAVLTTSLGWYAGKSKRDYHRSKDGMEISLTPIGGSEDDGAYDGEPLVGLEAMRASEGAASHEYLTSIDWATPEDETLTENLREFLERKAIEACGAEAWSIYRAVVVQEKSQAEVAETHDLSQQRVSQLVREVGLALKAALTAAA